MQKQAPTLGRLLTMVLFALSCFGLLLFLWLAFGGAIPLKPKGYRVFVAIPEANQLAIEADVRVSGVSVGKIREKERLPGGNMTLVGMELDRAVAPLDTDGDGRITPADASWSRLVLWRDVDQDRASQPGELRGLDAEGIVAIELDYRTGFRCEAGGCEGERSRVIWRDGSGAERRGAVIDVRLADR